METDLQVYQIYYQEDQKEHLFLDAIPYFNQELGLYFENDVILDLYRAGKIKGDYFGVLSWKTRLKNRIRTRKLHKLINYRFDMYSFTYDRHDVLGYADVCHPGFSEIFQELLSYLGINLNQKPLVGLYQNAVITRPEIYLDYIESILLPTLDFFDNCSEDIQQLLYADAKYRGVDQETLKGSIGVEFYTHHTFVLERLWSLFYQLRRDKSRIKYVLTKIHPRAKRSVQVNSKGRLHRFNL